MKRAERDNWTKALRSGEYIQGKKKLQIVDNGIVKHCCLGVLCVINKIEAERGLDDPRYGDGIIYNFLGSSITITARARDIVGLPDSDPYISIPGKVLDGCWRISCAGMNDSGFTFNQIADMIDYFLEVED